MDAPTDQEYLSLGPQSSYSTPLRKAFNSRILALCTCVAIVTIGALILPSNREQRSSSSNDMLDMFALQNMRGGIQAGTGPVNKWKNLALIALGASNRCDRAGVREVSMQAAVSSLDKKSKAKVAKLAEKVVVRAEALVAQNMSGISGPLGFFDPLGFSTDIPEGKLLFYREVELKHGRLCMLASLGILVAEKFHPLFGGNIDAPAAFAFQQTPLQQFWQIVLAALFAAEFASIRSFQPLWDGGELWQMKTDRTPGDFDFDPLGLKPTNEQEFKELQTKELNNGRLAMIAAAGMIAQELATGKTLF